MVVDDRDYAQFPIAGKLPDYMLPGYVPDPMTEAGIPWSEYGGYLDALQAAGYSYNPAEPAHDPALAARVLAGVKTEIAAKESTIKTGGVPMALNGYAPPSGLPAVQTTTALLYRTGTPAPDIGGGGGFDVDNLLGLLPGLAKLGLSGLTKGGLLGLLGGVAGGLLLPGLLEGNGAVGEGSQLLGGPGIPEPKAGTYSKTWKTLYERRDGRNGYVFFWLMNNGWVLSYNNLTKRSKYWKPKKPIGVIMQGSNMRMKDYLRIDTYLDRFTRRLAKRSKRLRLEKG